jgi:hypothetical protein
MRWKCVRRVVREGPGASHSPSRRAGLPASCAGAVEHAQQRPFAQQARRERRSGASCRITRQRAGAVDKMQGHQPSSVRQGSPRRCWPRAACRGCRASRLPLRRGAPAPAWRRRRAVSGEACRAARSPAVSGRLPSSAGQQHRVRQHQAVAFHAAPAAGAPQQRSRSLRSIFSLHPVLLSWLPLPGGRSRRRAACAASAARPASSAASCCMVGSAPVAGSRQASG